MSPFSLIYGHDVILPMEVVLLFLRVVRWYGFTLDEYNEAMAMELEDLDEARMDAFNRMVAQKKKVARAYNKRVKKKSFVEGKLV